MANSHSCARREQKCSSAELVQQARAQDGQQDVNHANHNRDVIRSLAAESSTDEKVRAVIQYGVDSGELVETVQKDADENSDDFPASCAMTLRLRKCTVFILSFVFVYCRIASCLKNEFVEFFFDMFGLSQPNQHFFRICDAVDFNKPFGRFNAKSKRTNNVCNILRKEKKESNKQINENVDMGFALF